MAELLTQKPGVGWADSAVFQVGRGKTLAVPMTLHNAARKKLVDNLRANQLSAGIVLLQGGEDQNQYDTDTEITFRYS